MCQICLLPLAYGGMGLAARNTCFPRFEHLDNCHNACSVLTPAESHAQTHHLFRTPDEIQLALHGRKKSFPSCRKYSHHISRAFTGRAAEAAQDEQAPSALFAKWVGQFGSAGILSPAFNVHNEHAHHGQQISGLQYHLLGMQCSRTELCLVCAHQCQAQLQRRSA